MTGGKTPTGEDDAAAVRAAIDEKERVEEHWRRAGDRAPGREAPPPRGAETPGEAPPAPDE